MGWSFHKCNCLVHPVQCIHALLISYWRICTVSEWDSDMWLLHICTYPVLPPSLRSDNSHCRKQLYLRTEKNKFVAWLSGQLGKFGWEMAKAKGPITSVRKSKRRRDCLTDMQCPLSHTTCSEVILSCGLFGSSRNTHHACRLLTSLMPFAWRALRGAPAAQRTSRRFTILNLLRTLDRCTSCVLVPSTSCC